MKMGGPESECSEGMKVDDLGRFWKWTTQRNLLRRIPTSYFRLNGLEKETMKTKVDESSWLRTSIFYLCPFTVLNFLLMSFQYENDRLFSLNFIYQFFDPIRFKPDVKADTLLIAISIIQSRQKMLFQAPDWVQFKFGSLKISKNRIDDVELDSK